MTGRKNNKTATDPERMVLGECEIDLSGAKVERVLVRRMKNFMPSYDLRIKGAAVIKSSEPISALEAYMVVRGLTPQTLADQMGGALSATTLRNQRYTRVPVRLLAVHTGLSGVLLAGADKRTTWTLEFDGVHVVNSNLLILSEEEMQDMARRMGVALPPREEVPHKGAPA
jgi:hypothetical protein